jgi:ABC-type lipoprotein export system ATPase subunit
MITHNPEAARNCNRIIQMRDGKIVENEEMATNHR